MQHCKFVIWWIGVSFFDVTKKLKNHIFSSKNSSCSLSRSVFSFDTTDNIVNTKLFPYISKLVKSWNYAMNILNNLIIQKEITYSDILWRICLQCWQSWESYSIVGCLELREFLIWYLLHTFEMISFPFLELN